MATMATETRGLKRVEGVDEKDHEIANSEPYIDPEAEKRLVRKLDWMLSPMMVLIFLVAYLDRANIGT